MRLIIVALTLVIAATPSEAHADHGVHSPRFTAQQVARCLSYWMNYWEQQTTGPSWVEDLPTGYRVVTPLSGQPNANRDVQTPPPAVDALAWSDLYRFDDPQRAPKEVTGIGDTLVDTGADGPVYYVRFGGYFYFGHITTASACLRGALGVF